MHKRFYIFRHGQSTYNIAGRTQGQTNDSVLTNLGRKQAVNIGQRLKDKNIELIICSPLRRSKQTAELVNQSLNVPIIDDMRFIEVDVGIIEGMHFSEIERDYAEEYKKWRSSDLRDDDFHFEGGESKREVRQRVMEGLEYYVQNSPFTNIAISSHGIMLSQILVQVGYKQLEISNGTIICLEYNDGIWKITGIL
ncbi:MAG: histidine phosphatase family protein [Alphaproteobacteria bacterium]